MAVGLSTSGTLFGIRAAEQTILRGRTTPPGYIPVDLSDYGLAVATLLRATANGAYRAPAEVIRALGDTLTHEAGHVLQAEQTLLRYKGTRPTGYLIITLENCLMTLLRATSTGYRPNPQVIAFIVEIDGVSAGA